ncbi:MAG: enoyl-CoA hydratase/isomerase family protein [Acidimicrobiales bacterium]
MAGVTLDRYGSVAVMLIDRPEAMNAINRATIEEFRAAVEEVEHSDARVLVVRGGGNRVFVSGGDLKELAAIRSAEEASSMALQMRDVLDRLARLSVPVIAAINGSAFGGGCEVAMACDFRVAASDVHLAFNQIDLAIMPAWGGLERLCELVGYGRAMYLTTTGSRITATTAADWGLVEVLVERAEFESTVTELASRIAKAPRSASGAVKHVASAGRRRLSQADTQDAVDRFAELWVDDEHWRAAESIFSDNKATGRNATLPSKNGALDGNR